MDTQTEKIELDPDTLLEVQQEQINALMRENLMLGALVRQQKKQINSLLDSLEGQQKGDDVDAEG